MTHYDIFNYKGVSESREVARGPKDPPPGVIGLNLKVSYSYSVTETHIKNSILCFSYSIFGKKNTFANKCI